MIDLKRIVATYGACKGDVICVGNETMVVARRSGKINEPYFRGVR
jgi:hypothetical protein